MTVGDARATLGDAPSAAPATVRVEVLGPLRLLVEGVTVDVHGAKRRVVLALLALAEGRTVTVGQLLDALWPSEVPESGRQALHSHVSRLRGQLAAAAARLQTRNDGYRLELGRDELDLTQARALLAEARAGVQPDPAGAHALLRQAHALWRGPVLADLTDVAPVAAAAQECEQMRRDVTDALVGSAVAAGQSQEVVGLAAASVTADPLREPAVMLLMRVLAATGQAPVALRAGRDYRHRLAEETGLDPSPALAKLEREIAGGAAGPPPSRPLAHTHSTTRLIGREKQVAALHQRLAAARLVTLVGPGGVGKTRVACEVARNSDSAPVLPLAPVTDPAAIPHALAAVLGLDVVQGDVLSACVAVLGEAPSLLVIDNCEHLLDAVCDTVGVLLASCPRLCVLATSREPLGVAAEYAFRLGPLALPSANPDAEQELAHVPSVAIFLDRAGRVRPGFAPTLAELRTVADIVQRLDGMPLAIELAAGRMAAFSVDDLRSRLDRALDLFGGRPGGDRRHRTLRATVDWSYQLLTEDERRLFRHLSVFADGVDLVTAERVAADLALDADPGSALARLVDASMLDAEFTAGGTRYRMLHTLRTFGLDRLAAAGEDEAAAGRLLRWAVGLTAWIEAAMSSEHEPQADAVLRRELPNLRAAWRLARGRGAVDEAAAIITALWSAVIYRDLVEVRGWAEELAGDSALAGHPREAAVLGTAAEAAYHRGDYQRAARLARAGLERSGDDASAWYCLVPLSVADMALGAYADCVEHAVAAAAHASNPAEPLAQAALATAYAGDLERARMLNQQGLTAAASPSQHSFGAYVAGEIDSLAGRDEQAERHYLHAIELARGAGATFLAGVASVGLLTVRAADGRVREALAGYRDVLDYFARTGNWTHQWVTLRNLATLLRQLGDDKPAALLDAAVDHAPDAPATERAPAVGPATPNPGLSRQAVLEVAREAIERNLARAEA